LNDAHSAFDMRTDEFTIRYPAFRLVKKKQGLPALSFFDADARRINDSASPESGSSFAFPL
jgi:hypothetical protein